MCGVNDSSSAQYADNVFSCNNWTHLVVLGNAGAGKVYSNGILKGIFLYWECYKYYRVLSLVAAVVSANFNGLIDEVRVYNARLDPRRNKSALFDFFGKIPVSRQR